MNFREIEATCLNDNDSPWIPFSPARDDVAVKYFNIDPVVGQVILISKNVAGVRQPRHHHTGPVIVYTIAGSWWYEEQDWVAHAGSIVYEVANTDHTPVIGDEGVIALNIVQGESHFYDESGKLFAVETWRTHFDRYVNHCRENGIKPRDLSSFSGILDSFKAKS
jgi:hypothetical protein